WSKACSTVSPPTPESNTPIVGLLVLVTPYASAFRCPRVDDGFHRRDAVCRKTTLLCVFADGFLARCIVDAIDLVVGDEALHPLDLWHQVVQHPTRLLRNRLQLLPSQFPYAWNLSFNHVFRHRCPCRTNSNGF